MEYSPTSQRRRRRGLSLQRKLPLAASILVLFLLALYSWIGYREVATSALVAASERDIRLAAELAQVTSASTALRARLVSRIANRPAVHRALTDAHMEPLDTAFEALRLPTDSTLTVILFNTRGEPIHFTGDRPDAELISRAYPLFSQAERSDTLSVTSPLFEHKGRAHLWTVARVNSNGQTIGYVAQFRQVRTSAATERTLDALLGADNRILFVNRDGTLRRMVSLDGKLQPPQENVTEEGGYQRYSRSGASYIAASDSVAGSPLRIVIETPVASTQARANEFLKRTGMLGLLLLVAATAIVWLVSRRVTQPITELSASAEAIARGDYDRRAAVDRNDELGALGQAFNQMADEIQRSMAESQESRAEAERANRAKSEFLANMSHEIRTPINAMLGYADLIEAGVSGPVTEQQRRQLERIKLSGNHLTGLVNDLLDFARLETAHLSVGRRVAPAASAIGTAVTVVEPEAGAKSVKLSTHIEGDPHYVGDPKRVEQILVNLLGNAVKFTPVDGSVRLECRTIRTNGEAHTEFVVEDTGVGIPADRIDSIFEPFVQGQTGYTRPHGGSGLGLTISQRLAEAMDGRISLQSEEGAGSRFTVTLPAP